ncbi:hypothetical protein SAMN05444401_3976 [Clostridium amylolyticum]|uniref:Uncharacterized protein n=1 Tax=Clostridium amylolyticum TaxID=1121298 RepID=A0A1M6MFA3_9CLOT|nr:hypothetical protein [Clostridium amylolyticum]SHJ82023.1 hypothetical protein SAMN05444401_3976 [Clostridium amylolyticum]
MKFNKGLLSISSILTIATILFLPYSFSDGFQFKFGYPFSFATLYNLPEPIKPNEILISRIYINGLMLVLDILIVYLTLNYLVELVKRRKIKTK